MWKVNRAQGNSFSSRSLEGNYSADCPKARLILLGNGPLLEDMKKFAAATEITATVNFWGHANNVYDFLCMTDIFVLLSLHEGMPNSLLAAMACELPVVTTRIGGVVDIVKDGENGIIVPPGDHKSLAEGLTKLLQNENYARTIAENAYYTIKNHYSLDRISSRYIELYKKLIGLRSIRQTVSCERQIKFR